MEDSDQLNKDISGELAAALRKSWSEAVPIDRNNDEGRTPNSMAFPQNPLSVLHQQEDNSPTGTPINHSFSENIRSTLREQEQQIRPNILVDTSHISTAPDDTQDYQLFKHHYSIQEGQRDSVTDILQDLELEPPSMLQSTLQQEQQASTQIPPIQGHPTNMRRSSIQDVQWVRQLLNPRSSFSGISTNEPTTMNTNVVSPGPGMSTVTTTGTNIYTSKLITVTRKGWITILKDMTLESIKSILVLYRSLQLTNSNYPLYVLYDCSQGKHNYDVNKLKKLSNLIPIPISFQIVNKTWDQILLFLASYDECDVTGGGGLELGCYISPSCLIVENIDELLELQEIVDEIDNETCVLLANDEIDPELIIFRPNDDIKMCIKEFFTIYETDDNIDERERVKKFATLNDFDVLKELFVETWGHLTSDGYVIVLNENVKFTNENNEFNQKIFDFKTLKPWNMSYLHHSDIKNDDTMCGKWNQIWLDVLDNNQSII
ncbi:Ids2p NDAI_0G06290 [Naumovozyma dairenensis CBS 421]|uniref:Uncharacterized protein n=1 Tax=Naumovozyma dairenensis (strain ATCC 10597 / BCRC 20456 / CBS 421 / NBRC 0211 / NRRL Y-12639) TaxID=1071378 RepID=J7RTP6_NAUDC|nr:hypothetical protein NDAI_0G06290 [Naumovozyma dairenensis CBS 421]CCK73612.1 hypothetical protein NDAI_0G06290 [Naumovozyma dairenensis CBS 421]